MNYGYAGRIGVIDLSDGSIEIENRGEQFYRDILGGEGIGAWLINEKVPVGADPLGPHNGFCIATGFLTGSTAPSSPRVMVMTKSPITGGFGDSNAGGKFGPELKKCGFDALYVTGKADKPVGLKVTDNLIEIVDATKYWGLDTVTTQNLVKEEIGGKSTSVTAIGPAGEKQSLMAAVMVDDRAAARSGVGAVMGSKNLKFISATGTQKTPIYDLEMVKKINKDFRDYIMSTDYFVIDVMRKYGSCGFMSLGIKLGIGPIKNWLLAGEESYPNHEKIDGPVVNQYRKKRHGCFGCPIACGGTVVVEDGEFRLEAARMPEYETIQAFAPFILCDDIEATFKAQLLCDTAGIDTISTGHAVAYAIECFENGIITEENTGGLRLSWGDPSSAVKLTEMICNREGFGAVLADGVRKAVERIGPESEPYAIHIGGQEPAFHDFRYEPPSRGVTYISDPTPARHERCSGGQLLHLKMSLGPDLEFQPFDVEKDDFEGLGRLYAKGSKYYSAFSSSGFCAYTLGATSRLDIVNLIRGTTGWTDYTAQDFLDAGERTFLLRQFFTLREGINYDDIRFPARLEEAPLFEGGLAGKRNVIDWYEFRKKYFLGYGLDPETGMPMRSRMDELRIGHLWKESVNHAQNSA